MLVVRGRLSVVLIQDLNLNSRYSVKPTRIRGKILEEMTVLVQSYIISIKVIKTILQWTTDNRPRTTNVRLIRICI